MRPEKRNAVLAATQNGAEIPSASEGNLLRAIYPTACFAATDFAADLVSARYRLPASTARVVVELAQLGARTA